VSAEQFSVYISPRLLDSWTAQGSKLIKRSQV
jgi:hypothetical protein